MNTIALPAIIQSVGLACLPVQGASSTEPALRRRPVAAAVLTLQRRSDGHVEVVAATLSDAREDELPLPWLLEQVLVAGVPTVVSREDRVMLAIEATARGLVAGPRLAGLCGGAAGIDPRLVAGEIVRDEAALCARLRIAMPSTWDAGADHEGTRPSPSAVMDVALGHAVARLMLWAHRVAFEAGEPDTLFETLLPLRDWMVDRQEQWPSLAAAARSEAIGHVAALASEYRVYRDARDAGGPVARWGTPRGGFAEE